MKKISKVALIALSVIVTGCSSSKPDIVVEKRFVEVEVVDINRPKHYHVKFKNLSSGEVVQERIGKRCSTHYKIQIGQKHQLEMVIKQREDKQQYIEYTNLKEVFCPK